MSKRKPPLDEKALEWFRRMGRKGGKIGGTKGGKASLVKMTKAAGIARARAAGLASVWARQPTVLERGRKVAELRAAGKSMAEIAAELGIGTSTAYQLARRAREMGA